MQVSDALTGSINLPSAGREVGDFELISRITLNSAQAIVTFGGIPQNYKHIQLKGQIMTSGATNPTWSVNSDSTSSRYRGHHFWGTGATSSSNAQAGYNGVYFGYNPSATYPSVFTMDWIDYAHTSKFKTFKGFAGSDTNGGTVEVALWSGLYMSTDAINSITLNGNSANFVSGSVFSLYGIRG